MADDEVDPDADTELFGVEDAAEGADVANLPEYMLLYENNRENKLPGPFKDHQFIQ